MLLLLHPKPSVRVAIILTSLLVAVAGNRLAAEEPVSKDEFTLIGHDRPVEVVTFSADGSLMATIQTWDGDKKLKGLKVWDLATRKSLYHLPYKEAWSATFTASGELVTAPSLLEEEVPINLREGRTGKVIRKLPELTHHVKPEQFLGGVDEMACMPKRNQVVIKKNWLEIGERVDSKRGGAAIEIFDVKTGERVWREHLGGHFCTAMALSPDGHRLAVGIFPRTDDKAYDKLLRTSLGEDYNFYRGRPIVIFNLEKRKLEAILPGHLGRVTSLSFSPDGKMLASGGDVSVRIWNLATGKERAIWAEDPVWSRELGKVRAIWADPKKGTIQAPLDRKKFDEWAAEFTRDKDGPDIKVAFAPDSKSVVASWPGIENDEGDIEGGVFLLDAIGGKDIRRLPDRLEKLSRKEMQKKLQKEEGKSPQYDVLNFNLEKEIVCSLTYSPDGSHLALGYRGGWVRLMRIASLK